MEHLYVSDETLLLEMNTLFSSFLKQIALRNPVGDNI